MLMRVGAVEGCPLNEHELTVVAHLAEGRTSKETAREMGISPNTVNNVIVMMKLRCGYPGNTLGFVVKAIRSGWIQ